MTKLLKTGRNPALLARARATLDLREQDFRACEAHALSRHAAGEAAGAAAWAQIACHVGWSRPSAALTAPALEAMLHEIGCEHVPGRPSDRAGDARVLHVLTEAYSTGGHTRVLERWVQRDRRRSTVVLTDQRLALPDELTGDLAASGATLVPSLPGGDLLERARALRALACDHDLVVLNVHMHDVLPALAFADPTGRPPTIFFEHGSHNLWIGAGAADVFACIRDLEVQNATELRGIPSHRVRHLPLPAADRVLPPRDAARQQLGLAPETPVIATVASPWKVRPTLEPTFQQLCGDLLAANPEATMIVVGPGGSDIWREALQRSGGRLQLPGRVDDIGPLLAAADVYFDSWPVSGSTTILDVAAAGLPIVSLTDDTRDMRMVRAVARLGEGAISASSPEDAVAAVTSLLTSPPRRATMGRASREAIAADHADGWTAHLDDLVATAHRHRGTARPFASARTTPPDWQCMLEVLAGATMPAVHDVVRYHLHYVPEAERPQDLVALGAQVDEILARGANARRSRRHDVARRAVAQPPLDQDAVDATVRRFRQLVSDGDVQACVVVLSSDGVEAGVAMLQAALDDGPDVEIDIVIAPSLDGIAAPSDLMVTAA
jgi:hypothetical protein